MPSSVISHRTTDTPGPYDNTPINVPSNKANNVLHHFEPHHHQDAQTVGRAVGFRMIKAIKRGQLPFLLLFFG